MLALSIVNLCWNLYLLAGDVLVLSLYHGLVHVEFLFRDDDGHVAREARVLEVDLGVCLVGNSPDVS